MALLPAPDAPELVAMTTALACMYGRPQHIARRDAIRLLNELGGQHWQLDRTAQGIRIDTAAEAAELEAAA